MVVYVGGGVGVDDGSWRGTRMLESRVATRQDRSRGQQASRQGRCRCRCRRRRMQQDAGRNKTGREGRERLEMSSTGSKVRWLKCRGLCEVCVGDVLVNWGPTTATSRRGYINNHGQQIYSTE